MTPANRPALAHDPDEKVSAFSARLDVLQNDGVRYAGQPIALVIGETLEAASEGARLLSPAYREEPARMGLDGGVAFQPETVGISTPASGGRGDVESARSKAAQSVTAEIETPLQYHNAMETHAIVAQWDGDQLIVDTPNQALYFAQDSFATYFGIAPEKVTVRSPYLGGGFGSKAVVYGTLILAALAAKELGRPVKLVHKRTQMFGPVQHRSATRQRVRLDLDGQGKLLAIDHHSLVSTSSFDDWLDSASNISCELYQSEAIKVSHSGVRMDTGTPGAMRAPGMATGSSVLEVAMDMAAEKMGMDPVDYRLLNYADTHPIRGLPWSSKALRECYSAAAARFGWEGRPLEFGQMRDENGLLVGWGMGTAIFHAPFFPAQASAIISSDGHVRFETSGADMGQGAWTVLAQMAADSLGMEASDIELEIGRTGIADGSVAGGSAHTASAGSALFAAGLDAVRQLAALATADPESPLFGAGNEGCFAQGGMLRRTADPEVGEPLADIMRRAGIERLVGDGRGRRENDAAANYAMASHGAVFAEVKVDPDLKQVRVTRLIGAFAAGRIINPLLAKSQLNGGMIWGLSFALHEEGLHDPTTGRPLNGDLAGYHIPVNADVPHVESILVHEDDPHVNSLGVKGVGELGITGSVGAIANAVWHATGRRITRYPIHPRDLC